MESGYSTESPIPKVIQTKSKVSLEQDTKAGKKI